MVELNIIILFNIEDPWKVNIILASPSPLHPNIYLCRYASLYIEKETAFSYFPKDKKKAKKYCQGELSVT